MRLMKIDTIGNATGKATAAARFPSHPGYTRCTDGRNNAASIAPACSRSVVSGQYRGRRSGPRRSSYIEIITANRNGCTMGGNRCKALSSRVLVSRTPFPLCAGLYTISRIL